MNPLAVEGMLDAALWVGHTTGSIIDGRYWDVLRWVNAVMSALVVVLLLVDFIRAWPTLRVRERRVWPWIIMTYVVLAYGSGEIAASEHPVSPGVRVGVLALTIIGLAVALIFGHYGAEKEDPDPEDQ